MAFKPVGIDENGNLPARARSAVANSSEVAKAVVGGVVGKANKDRGQLRRFRAALENNSANVIVCGDSWTEGTRGADAPFLRFVDHLTAAIRSRADNPQGGIYIPSYATYATRLPANWTYTGTVTNQQVMGLGFYNVLMSSGAVASLTYKGTGFRIYLGRDAGYGSVEIRVDGALIGTYSVANATTDSTFTRDVLGLANTTHTVTITATGGNAMLLGAYCYDGDETTGVRVYPAGRGGIKSDAMTMTHFGGQLSATTPDLVILEYGINDYRNAVTPATVKANYLTGVNAVRSRTPIADASIVMLVTPEPVISGTPAVAPWSDYVKAIKEAADESGSLLVDLSPVFNDGVLNASSPLVNTDQTHPNDPGHRAIASAIAQAILPPVAIRPAYRERQWVPATAFIANGGTPNLDVTNGTAPTWKLDPDAQESVITTVGLPGSWQGCAVDLWFVNPNVSSGAMSIFCRTSGIVPNGATPAPTSTTKTVTAGAQFVTTVSTAHHTTATDPVNLLRLMVQRNAADAADTLANDTGFIGAMLRRTA